MNEELLNAPIPVLLLLAFLPLFGFCYMFALLAVLVALWRDHPSKRGIVRLSLLLGWFPLVTFLCVVWALRTPRVEVMVVDDADQDRKPWQF